MCHHIFHIWITFGWNSTTLQHSGKNVLRERGLDRKTYLSLAAYSLSMTHLSLTKSLYLSAKSIPFCVWDAMLSNWSWKIRERGYQEIRQAAMNRPNELEIMEKLRTERQIAKFCSPHGQKKNLATLERATNTIHGNGEEWLNLSLTQSTQRERKNIVAYNDCNVVSLLLMTIGVIQMHWDKQRVKDTQASAETASCSQETHIWLRDSNKKPQTLKRVLWLSHIQLF